MRNLRYDRGECTDIGFHQAVNSFATEYTFAHIGLNNEFKDRVRMGYYEAGHMMYVHKASHQKLKKDIAAFIQWASGK